MPDGLTVVAGNRDACEHLAHVMQQSRDAASQVPAVFIAEIRFGALVVAKDMVFGQIDREPSHFERVSEKTAAAFVMMKA